MFPEISRSVHSESLNDPCRGSELVTMYRELKTQIWGETKEKMTKLRFEQKQKDRTKVLIKVKTPTIFLIMFCNVCCAA